MRKLFRKNPRVCVLGLIALAGLITGLSLIEYYGPLADAYNPNWEIQDTYEFYDFLGYVLTITGGALLLVATAVWEREHSSPMATSAPC